MADEIRRWLEDPLWPQFGPGIGSGPLDPGRTAARAAAQQCLDVLGDSTVALVPHQWTIWVIAVCTRCGVLRDGRRGYTGRIDLSGECDG